MNPDRIRLLMQAELDGQIDPEGEAELQQALAASEALRSEYRELAELKAVFRADRAAWTPPAGLVERIVAGLPNANRAPRGRLLEFSRYLKPASQAAAVLILVGAAFWTGSRTTSAANEGRVDLSREDMVVLLRKHPGLDADKVGELRDWYLEEHRRLEVEAQERRAEVDRRYEERMARLVDALETGESR